MGLRLLGALVMRLLGRREPRLRGALRVSGIRAGMTIRRDGWGIPHVEAETPPDAWFGLGFCHAQDRAFQLETNLRAASGTLSAMFGPATLGFDRLARRLGFRRVAARQLPLLAPELRLLLDAYVDGINAGLTRGRLRVPHELALVRAAACTAWHAEDVLAFGALQSFALGANWDIELARLKILVDDGPEALLAVDPGHADWLPVTSPVGATAGEALAQLSDDVAAFREATMGAGASNAWALAGSRTSSGHPILAGDPHLPPVLPPQWYLAHLRTPDWQLAGATLVGGPAFPVGHNGFAAWSITAALTDASDLFIEQLDGADGVRGPSGREQCITLREEIEVRGGTPVVEEVLVTPRGPLISPALDDAPHALSLRAVWLEPMPLRGFLDVAEARSFEAFRRAFAEWPGPALNVVYADAGGHIGWQLIGQLPRRRSGYGTIPRPAWEPGVGWDGTVPFDEMPHALDPDEGWLASANNAPRPDAADSPFLGVDWLDGYRMARIAEVLAEAEGWGPADSQRLQLDVTTVAWREMRPAVMGVAPRNVDAQTAVRLLAAWDGRAAADSPAAAVYELFRAEMAARTAARRAPNSWRWALGAGFGEAVPRTLLVARASSWLIRLLRTRPAGWFDDWDVAISEALSAAVERLRTEHGDDPTSWAWGRVRPLTLQHPFGRQPVFDRSFNIGPFAWGGDSNTPAQASVRPLDPLGNPGGVGTTRAVFDLGNLEASRFVLAGGQSGNPRSRHYRDLLEHWRRGDGVPILLEPAAVTAAAVTTLRLEPAPTDR